MSVPNTTTFTLQDVQNEIGENNLSGCFTYSVDSLFDARYKGSKDRLSNFRNYNNRYNDWFLPSRNELREMIIVGYNYSVGSFTNQYYWSSTEDNSTHAVSYSYPDYSGSYALLKSNTCAICAARSFLADSSLYNVGDMGPATGYIFYKIDEGGGNSTYYEFSPTEATPGSWSNIQDTLIGSTSNDIGEGLNNSNEIVAQSGHTTSAAKKCLDLII